MRKHITTAVLVGALSTVPVVGFASAPGKAQTSAVPKNTSTSAVATHATRGVVKSVDAATIVITRTGRSHDEMTFAVNSSTQREGTVAVGTPVSVRYREEGKTYIATAIRVQKAEQQATHTAPSKR